MSEIKVEQKLHPIWKKAFLNKLRNGCYKYISGDWYRRITDLEFEEGLEQGQTHEYAHCVLGAVYHHSTGKNHNSEGWKRKEVPDVFRNADIRDHLIGLNDGSKSKSYNEVADWIEKNL